MYLAPLNYDRFFKKVFSNKAISKQFLEDFLDVKIDEIEILKEKHRITDDASVVEFDFRCKIDDAYIIVDMQQWYKMDVIKRFHLYHSLNSSLQLETLPVKQLALDKNSKKIKKTKDYHYVEPVLTIIWMVDDTLGFKENYISYALTPEITVKFIENEKLWTNPELTKIIKEQQKISAILKNDTKGISFLAKNKLMFLFQKNIVKNKQIDKYVRWFQFAEKTKNKKNEEKDFEAYQRDEVFIEIIKRIIQDKLSDDEYTYLQDQEEFWENYTEITQRLYHSGLVDGEKKGRETGRETGREEGKEEEGRMIAKKMRMANIDLAIISDVTGLSVSQITKLD